MQPQNYMAARSGSTLDPDLAATGPLVGDELIQKYNTLPAIVGRIKKKLHVFFGTYEVLRKKYVSH